MTDGAENGVEETGPESVVVENNKLLTVFAGGLFFIVLFGVMRYASMLFVPIVFAIVLNLVLQPLCRKLEDFKIPRAIGAIFIIGSLLCGFWTVGSIIATPATQWAQKLPESLPQLKSKLRVISKPIEQTKQVLSQADDLTKGEGPRVAPVSLQGTKLSDKIFMSTQSFLGAVFTIILLLFFLLSAGDTFLRRFVEVLPSFSNKRQVVNISHQIQQDMSAYLLTITVMNAVVGVLTAVILWSFGSQDALLWGTAAFVLNYVPIVGPLIAGGLFFIVSLMTVDSLGDAALPAGLYYLVHFIESTYLTPMLLARRFTLNPVLVILSLIFWYWMWGLPGAILSVPMLAMVKIICDHIESLNPVGHFLGR